MALFLDTFINKIDRKGRVSVPASYRQQLAGQPFQGIVAMPSFKHRAITCGGIDWMAGIEREIAARVSLFSEEHDDLSMAVFSDAKQLTFDTEGRVVLPPSLIECARLGEVAAFVGRGATFDIWEPTALDAYKAQARSRALDKGRTVPRGGATS
jgi:MraZ protein